MIHSSRVQNKHVLRLCGDDTDKKTQSKPGVEAAPSFWEVTVKSINPPCTNPFHLIVDYNQVATVLKMVFNRVLLILADIVRLKNG